MHGRGVPSRMWRLFGGRWCGVMKLHSLERGRILIETDKFERIDKCLDIKVDDKVFGIHVSDEGNQMDTKKGVHPVLKIMGRLKERITWGDTYRGGCG
ncbi:hypothetical protein V6N13_083556 [Hibiscus sabdariffa]